MKQQGAKKRQNRQYSTATRVQKGLAKGKLQIQELFDRLSKELPALQQLHLSSRILFQKYAKDLNTTALSQSIRRALIEKFEENKMSSTIEKNIREKIKELSHFGLVPTASSDGGLGSEDPLTRHFSPLTTIALSKIESVSDMSEIEIREVISYFEQLRSIVQKPERHFARSVKCLRNENRIYRKLIGSGKVDVVLKELWRQEGFDWEAMDKENFIDLVDKLDDAFSNE